MPLSPFRFEEDRPVVPARSIEEYWENQPETCNQIYFHNTRSFQYYTFNYKSSTDFLCFDCESWVQV